MALTIPLRTPLDESELPHPAPAPAAPTGPAGTGQRPPSSAAEQRAGMSLGTVTISAEENRQIFERSIRSRDCAGMGTTVVGALFSKKKNRIYVGHVGDSRAYRVRKGSINQLTRDHSLFNDYIMAMPELTEEQRAELPRNVITRALGMQDSVVVDLISDEPQPGERHWFAIDRSVLAGHGIALLGPPAREVFAEISSAALRPVLADVLRWYMREAPGSEDAALNAGRSLRFARDGVWVAKPAMREWVAAQEGTNAEILARAIGELEA